jgi:putative transposase
VSYRRSGEARLFLKLHRGEVCAKQVLGFLRHLLRHIPGKVIVLWDGLAAHRAFVVREWAGQHTRLRIVRLPAYAPELNPVEGLWSWAKGTLLANVCENELAPITARVRRGIRRARRNPFLLWRFLDKAELSL